MLKVEKCEVGAAIKAAGLGGSVPCTTEGPDMEHMDGALVAFAGHHIGVVASLRESNLMPYIDKQIENIGEFPV